MATRFGKFQALAQRLITKNARSVVYKVASTTPLNPAEPWGPNTADTLITAPAVFLSYEAKAIDGTVVLTGDKQCLIAALDLPGVQPKAKDRILDGTTDWEVVHVDTLQPGNLAETILYTVQVRS
jgi:hypothetical protein